MTTFRPPEHCPVTGRLLTEWYEHKEYTDEMLTQRVLDELGLDEVPTTGGRLVNDPELPEEVREIVYAFHHKRNSYKRRKWKHGMSDSEVAHRMNEATKLVNPDNFKFLDDEARARTGLEINPLWQMEVLYRSGLLPPKEQVALLAKLAEYTHSKAPSINQNTNINKAEDWLVELANDQYETVDRSVPERIQPVQRREAGSGPDWAVRRGKKDGERNALLEHQTAAFKALTEIEDYYIEEGFATEVPDDDS
jgi:hypothetical protein